MLKKLILISILSSFLACSEKPRLYKFGGKTMGTVYHITLFSTFPSDFNFSGLKKDVDDFLLDFNQEFSTWIKNSHLSKLNRNETNLLTPRLSFLLKRSQELSAETQGAFDITMGPLMAAYGFRQKKTELAKVKAWVGMEKFQLEDDQLIKKIPQLELDVSAVAKGHGVDEVANFLEKKGFKNYLVEIGGEIRVAGKKNKQDWALGIDRPISGTERKIQKIIYLTNKSMATSGNYRNFRKLQGKKIGHILDPRSKLPAKSQVVSVTVIADNCLEADAWATALMVLGRQEGLTLIEKKPHLEAMFIESGQNQLKETFSSGFNSFF